MAESLYRLIAGFLCKKSPEGRETFLSRVRFSAQVSNALSTATEVMKKRNRD
jgi:hypothetical protein